MGMQKRNEVELDLQIDPYRLDDEWVEAASLYGRYAMELADARRDFEEAKAALELAKAEIDTAIRRDPEAFGLAKSTENAVAAAIPQQDNYKEATQEVINARHRMDIVDGAVKSLDHRKKGLEKLVDLYFGEYYSKPRASAESREQMDEAEKRAVRQKGRRQR